MSGLCELSLRLDELETELPHSFRVDLADARLRDAEDLADLREREALEVIERDDDLLSLGERVDGGREKAPSLLGLEAGGGIDALVGERVDEGDLLPAVVADGQQFVEREDRHEGDLAD